MKTHPDGRMDILTEGKRRFEVLELNQERSFLQADVIYLDDENEPAAAPELETALRLHGEIMELAGAQPEDSQKTDSSQLAFRLAGSLPLDPDFQQTLSGNELRGRPYSADHRLLRTHPARTAAKRSRQA